MRLREMNVVQLRSLVSRKSGLPVSMFRMLSAYGLEMYDGHLLDHYDVQVGDTIRIETWDGVNNFLVLCQRGFASNALAELDKETDASIFRYLLRVALYMAAHFSHLDLASATIKLGVSPGEGVGEHPYRDWHRGPHHPDALRAPIHEASEFGTIPILRLFIHHDITNVLANDGNGLKPLNLALRNHQKVAASLLIAKQWMRQEYQTITLSIQFINRLRKWANRSRERAYMKYGEQHSTFRPKRGAAVHIGARIGEQRFFVTGFTHVGLSSKPQATLRKPNHISPIPKSFTQSGAVTHQSVKYPSKPAIRRPSKDIEEPSAEPEITLEENEKTNILENYFRRLGRVYEPKRVLRNATATLSPPLPPLVRRHPDGRIEVLPQSQQEADAGRRVTLAASSGDREHTTLHEGSTGSITDDSNKDACSERRSVSENRVARVNISSIDIPDKLMSSMNQPSTRLSFCAGTIAQTKALASDKQASTSAASGTDRSKHESLFKEEDLLSACDTSETRTLSRNTSSSNETGEGNHKREAEELSIKTSCRGALSNTHQENCSNIQLSTLNPTEAPVKSRVKSPMMTPLTNTHVTERSTLAKSSTPKSFSRQKVLVLQLNLTILSGLF